MNAIVDRQGVVGYVPGAWDMFHIGHLNILKRAREQCDWLVAGVVTDEALFEMKNKYPIVPFEERLESVASIGIVDEAVDRHLERTAVDPRPISGIGQIGRQRATQHM